MDTIRLSLAGYTDLPPGKIANVVTYFETRTPMSDVSSEGSSLSVRHVQAPKVRWYRTLLREIGEQWLWSGVETTPDDLLIKRLADPRNEVHVLDRGNKMVGIAELDRRQPGSVEVVHFGVVGTEIGTGAARFLMDETLRRAFAPGVERVWLHTCTFDHPGAVRFYLKSGLTPFKFAVEVMDDPRLTGHLPETAAPHVALIRPG